jgi:Putative auto-transporter adhesin, head GIN domain
VGAAFALPTPAHALTITIGGDGGATVVGSGHVVQTARRIGAFSTIRVDGSIDVDAHPGPKPGVTVKADDNIEPLVETVVEGDALVVRVKTGTSFRTSHEMKVVVEFAQLAGAQQHGSGDLHISALNGPKFDARISGSGDLFVDDAQVGRLAVSVAGSGDVHIAGRAARRVEVKVRGSGDADVNASEALAASVAGSGDVTYGGHPRDVSRSVAGSGSISAR